MQHSKVQFVLIKYTHKYRGKVHREKFPLVWGECSDSNSLDEVSQVSDSFHWLLDLETPDHDHAKCPFNTTDEEIVKKRRNFAITRSRSFAHPIGVSQRRPVPERVRKNSRVAFVNQEARTTFESLEFVIEVWPLSFKMFCTLLYSRST